MTDNVKYDKLTKIQWEQANNGLYLIKELEPLTHPDLLRQIQTTIWKLKDLIHEAVGQYR